MPYIFALGVKGQSSCHPGIQKYSFPSANFHLYVDHKYTTDTLKPYHYPTLMLIGKL